MTRKELIEKVAKGGRVAFVRPTDPEAYWRGLPEDAKICERRQAAAVLDLLTKETVRSRRHKDRGSGICVGDFGAGFTGPEVDLIILDLPDEPSATKRAAELLRLIADGATGWNFSSDDLRITAEALEKEAAE